MLFFKPRATKPEPTREQEEEERRFSERIRPVSPRTTTGETTQVVQLTNAALDAAVKKSRSVRDSAKTLQAQAAAAKEIVDSIKK